MPKIESTGGGGRIHVINMPDMGVSIGACWLTLVCFALFVHHDLITSHGTQHCVMLTSL